MIRTLLVANRGEIARRVFRTCRNMGIRTVAVYSDADVNAPFVTEADVAVRLGPPEPALSYLDIEHMIAAALASGADAIHPGYGFLAENADFAQACADAGLIFIGPSPDAITAMGSKLESKRIMDAAGVPTLPSIEVTQDTDLVDAAESIGYPVLVKASAGGGGKGMRVVATAAELAAAVEGATREAQTAFGASTVFLEKYLERPRHIEVQVFGDSHGTVVPLFERECSIQRRHQKVIEEAPSPAVDEALRSRLGEAAVAAATAVNYEGAGTVEFLLDTDGAFRFLEMNTRLQVEHPVTEMVTGLDLVQLQIEVAEGAALPAQVLDPTMTGHAIEARLYAEDPANDFLPSTGSVAVFAIGEGVRVDSGVENGSEVSVFYDPMLAKVIAHGENRDIAARTLAKALRSARIHGVTTNRELLVRVLEDEAFLAGDIDTEFLTRLDATILGAPLASVGEIEAMALAASLAGQARRRQSAAVMATIPTGFRNNASQLNIDTYRFDDRTLAVGYRIQGEVVTVQIDGENRPEAILLSTGPTSVRLRYAGLDQTFEVVTVDNDVLVDSATAGASFVRLPRLPVPEVHVDPGSLLSPMPGNVVRVEAAVGDTIKAGTPLVIVEAMKMEHTVAAPHDGVVASLTVAPGDQVESDQVLAVVDPA